MIRAYDKVYLANARAALARMLDFGVNELGMDLEVLFGLFIGSGMAMRFGRGECEVIAGRSGVELAYDLLEMSGMPTARRRVSYPVGRSREYWAGWAIAYYQWETGLSFAQVAACVSISEVRDLYDPYHEMDIRQFVDRMNELRAARLPETNLKRLRRSAGLSQAELGMLAGVPVRTIQQYEQRQKSINKASFETVRAISQVLCCDEDELAELS